QDFDGALTAYEKAIALRQDSFEAWFGKGAVLRKLERYEEAIAVYEQAIHIKGDSPLVYYNKGLSALDIGQYEEAVTDLSQAIQLKPDFQKAWLQKSLALRKLQRYPEAEAACLKATQLNPEDAEARYAQACCDALQNNVDSAIDDLKLAIQLGTGISERAKQEPDLQALQESAAFHNLLHPKE
ncbi:MAG: tetratricopeptide repeat protein, partial [Symploca sp. SIO2B6]|nr:tetratricopeptide repeat protein [Symploca sp. SIO2B6]